MKGYEAFTELTLEEAAPGVLRVLMEAPRLNSVRVKKMHGELADVWRSVDRDPEARVALLRGAGKAFSAGGSFELIDQIIGDEADRMRVMREAATSCSTSSSARSRSSRRSTGRRSAPGWSPRCSPTSRSSARTARIIDGHTRLGVAAGDHAAICWPLLCGMAKAKYYLLTCETLTGEEAERIGLVSLCVDDDRRARPGPRDRQQLAGMAQTRHPLDEAHAQPLVPQRRPDLRRVARPTSSSASAAPTPPKASPRTARSARPGSRVGERGCLTPVSPPCAARPAPSRPSSSTASGSSTRSATGRSGASKSSSSPSPTTPPSVPS